MVKYAILNCVFPKVGFAYIHYFAKGHQGIQGVKLWIFMYPEQCAYCIIVTATAFVAL